MMLLFVGVLTLTTPTFTGAATETLYSGKSAETTLNHIIKEEYDISLIEFPIGSCGRLAQEWYDMLAHEAISPESEVDSNVFFDTRRAYGEAELRQGRIILNAEVYYGGGEMPLLLDFSGHAKDRFVVTNGLVKTQEYECIFSNENGRAVCNC